MATTMTTMATPIANPALFATPTRGRRRVGNAAERRGGLPSTGGQITRASWRKSALRASADGEATSTSTSTSAATKSGPLSEAAAAVERSINSAIIGVAVTAIDNLYGGRSYARFHALETVARVPYFSFMSVLHLYETFGWWRKADYLKVHFAETMNEYHHLLIMESLGGAELWKDRFIAQHIAVAYYWICVGQYLISPRWAYNLLEQVESHAYATYDKFLSANEETLKSQPPPRVAVQYYTKGDLYLFDEFQTGNKGERRPKIDNLYDVFVNVRNDEAEHMKTMEFCQQPGNGLRSPSSKEAMVLLSEEACLVSPENFEACKEEEEDNANERSCEGLVDCVVNFGTGAVNTYEPPEN